jgi:triphosphatase
VRIERKVFPLHAGDATVELALDHGQIATAEKSEDVCEVEIELKEGDRAQLFHQAHLLARAAPLRLSVLSKAARGYELAESKSAEPVAADKVIVRAGLSTAEAFQTTAESCLYQVVANWEAVCRGDPMASMRCGSGFAGCVPRFRSF